MPKENESDHMLISDTRSRKYYIAASRLCLFSGTCTWLLTLKYFLSGTLYRMHFSHSHSRTELRVRQRLSPIKLHVHCASTGSWSLFLWRDVIVVCRQADSMESYDFMVALLGPDWAEKMKNDERNFCRN